MSRGPGRVQQAILRLLESNERLTYRQLAEAIPDTSVRAVNRACLALLGAGAVEITSVQAMFQPTRYAMIFGEPVFVDASYNGQTFELEPPKAWLPGVGAPRNPRVAVVRLAQPCACETHARQGRPQAASA